MKFLHDLFYNVSVSQSLLVLTSVIALGIILGGKLKIKGMTLGVTWILFLGIFFSAIGMQIDPEVGGFAKDFGLVLFVYSIGLSVGPSFFSSLTQGGLKLNLVAVGIVLLAVLCTLGMKFLTGEDMATMVGVMSGAITNTPSLGAAEQAFNDIHGTSNPNIAMAYAVAYPLAVVGIILSIMFVKGFFRINMKKEEENLQEAHSKEPVSVDVCVVNVTASDISINKLHEMCPWEMVVSRIFHKEGGEEVPRGESMVLIGDTLRIITNPDNLSMLKLLGEVNPSPKEEKQGTPRIISRKIAVTKTEWNGERLGKVFVHLQYSITITHVYRSGIELLATRDLRLQVGDRLLVVGEEKDVAKIAELFGNEMKRLDSPHLIPIFLGIALGVIFGLMPIALPGLSHPFKLGLAGGSLIIALLMGRFGPTHHVVTFSTASANLMLREVGLSLFLASVGLGAGGGFLDAIMNGGYMWVLYGLVITLIPLLIMGTIAYKVLHINYYTLMGVMAGATTDPPALAYSMSMTQGNDQPSVGYATVYPLTMFMRVLVAQLMVLLMC